MRGPQLSIFHRLNINKVTHFVKKPKILVLCTNSPHSIHLTSVSQHALCIAAEGLLLQKHIRLM